MSNLDRDLAEMKRLGYGNDYGRYKLDHPSTKVEPQTQEEPSQKPDAKVLDVAIYDYTCQYCGKNFAADRKGRKFCSKKCCRGESRRQFRQRQRNGEGIVMIRCIKCGREFIKKGNSKYCSPECSKIAALESQRKYDRKRRGNG